MEIKDIWDMIGWFAIGATTALVAMALMLIDEPTAMDVYQGKTTLEYKVVDGEKIDSVVVYKRIEE